MNDDLARELTNDMIVEGYDGLDRYDQCLLDLEKGQGNDDTINLIFREIHTIKGTSGSIGLSKIEKLTHTGENVLDALKEKEINVSSELITTLLKVSDALRTMFRSLETDFTEGDESFEDLVSHLSSFLEKKGESQSTSGWGMFDEEASEPPSDPVAEESADSAQNEATEQASEAGWGIFDEENTEKNDSSCRGNL